MYRKHTLLPLVGIGLAFTLLTGVCWAGSLAGQGRFERIAGNPNMGYQSLYEWDLFLSPSDDSMVGPSRRLGAPPGLPPRGDGYYRIDNLPEGTYSVYVNQPDFFASPKVIPDVVIQQQGVRSLNIDLDVDYSTYFRDTNQWTDYNDGQAFRNGAPTNYDLSMTIVQYAPIPVPEPSTLALLAMALVVTGGRIVRNLL